jgi:YHS domain-containing protein
MGRIVCCALAILSGASAVAGPAVPGGVAAVSRVRAVDKVCMVNDCFMGKPQIPVQVEGRTYYGCCEMCKTRLAQDAAVRSAKDPVTGKTVDKATAVIGQRPDGAVLYFESASTLARYNRQKVGRRVGAHPLDLDRGVADLEMEAHGIEPEVSVQTCRS